jgi:hypothetical protein
MTHMPRLKTSPNPILEKKDCKTGTELIIKRCNNGQGTAWEGKVVKVYSVSTDNYVMVERTNENGQRATTNLFFSGPADDFSLANRESQIALQKEIVKTKTDELNEAKKELEHLEKYASEEEFVADKIQKLMKSNSKTKMVQILKELKKSNML